MTSLDQVCCDGALHQVAATKECCGTNYVALRQRPSDICCDGRFVTYEENHQCCYGKYVKVSCGGCKGSEPEPQKQSFLERWELEKFVAGTR